MESELDECMDEFIRIQNEGESKEECKSEYKEECKEEYKSEYKEECKEECKTNCKEECKSECKEECKTNKQNLNNVLDNIVNKILKEDNTNGVNDLLNEISKNLDSFDIPISSKNHLDKAFKLADSILNRKKENEESKDGSDVFKDFLNIINNKNANKNSDSETSSVKSDESDMVIRITNNQTTEGTENIDTAHHYSTGDIPKETENKVESDIDNKVSFYKSILRLCFSLSENIMEKKGVEEICGFAEQQNLEMDKYEDLLRELAEKKIEPVQTSSIPVEIRLILVVMLNTILYVMMKRLQNSLNTPVQRPVEKIKFNILSPPPTVCRIPSTPVRCNKKNLHNLMTINKPKKETTTTVVTTTKNGVTTTKTTCKTIKY